MKIKHLQLNTSVLKYPEKVMNFMVQNYIDIACLQEIVYPIGSECPLKKAAERSGINYVEGIHYYNDVEKQIVGVAIISKLPILDYSCVYYNTPDYQPKHIGEKDLLGTKLIGDRADIDNFPGSRGLKHSIKSRCILAALIKSENGFIKIITTHFLISDLCTETVQMYEMGQLLNSLVKNADEKPTILSGDLNIRAESYSVKKIEEVMTCLTKNLPDTLSKDHISKKDFPKGLAIDHVFSKGLKHFKTEAVEIDFSEHKAIVSEFEM